MALTESRRYWKRCLHALIFGITLSLVTSLSIAQQDAGTEAPSANTERQTSDEQVDNQAESESQARPPGSFDIDEEAATRALERSLVQINALLLPPGKMELSLGLGFSSDATDFPVIITVANPDDTSQTINTLGVAQLENRNYDVALNASVGLPYDAQVSLNIPFASKNLFSSTALQTDTTEQSNFSIDGIGDIGLSLLKTIIKEKGRRPDIIARFSADFDTGDTNDSGLRTGSDAVEYTVGLSATKRQDPLVFSYQLSHTLSEEKNGFKAGNVTQLSLGAILAASPYTSIKLSFSQSVVGKATIDGADIERVNRAPATMSLGTSSVVGRSVFIYTDVQAGLNETATDYRISFGLSRQFSVF